jgi:hypothetical protein
VTRRPRLGSWSSACHRRRDDGACDGADGLASTDPMRCRIGDGAASSDPSRCTSRCGRRRRLARCGGVTRLPRSSSRCTAPHGGRTFASATSASRPGTCT